MLVITGTGRCGTATMARLFGGHHEFRVEYLLEKYFRQLDPRRPAFELRDERLAAMLDLLQGVSLRDFVDSSNLYIHFLDVLPLLDRDVKVILMTRDVRSFARSAVGREWHRREEYGMVPPAGDPWCERWDGLAPLERAAWIWQFRNGLALRHLEGYPPDRKRVVRVEDLSRDGTVLALEQFFGRPLADPGAAGVLYNADRDEGAGSGGQFDEGVMSDAFRELAAPLMKVFGYRAMGP